MAELERELRDYMANFGYPMAVNREVIRDTALQIASRLLGLNDFCASDEWIEAFMVPYQQSPPVVAAAAAANSAYCPGHPTPSTQSPSPLTPQAGNGGAAVRTPVTSSPAQSTTGAAVEQQSEHSHGRDTMSVVHSEDRRTASGDRHPKYQKNDRFPHLEDPCSVVWSRSSVKSAISDSADDTSSGKQEADADIISLSSDGVVAARVLAACSTTEQGCSDTLRGDVIPKMTAIDPSLVTVHQAYDWYTYEQNKGVSGWFSLLGPVHQGGQHYDLRRQGSGLPPAHVSSSDNLMVELLGVSSLLVSLKVLASTVPLTEQVVALLIDHQLPFITSTIQKNREAIDQREEKIFGQLGDSMRELLRKLEPHVGELDQGIKNAFHRLAEKINGGAAVASSSLGESLHGFLHSFMLIPSEKRNLLLEIVAAWTVELFTRCPPNNRHSSSREGSRQPKGRRVGCRVPGCYHANCLRTGHHYCKWCKDTDSAHFAADCHRKPGFSGEYPANTALAFLLPWPSFPFWSHYPSPQYSSPRSIQDILAHHAHDHGRAKEPTDVTRLLSTLQSAMGGRGGSFRGVEKMWTSIFIDETLPVLCDVLSKGGYSFPLRSSSNNPGSGMEKQMTARQCFALIGAGFLCLHKHDDPGSLNFDRLFDNSTPSGMAKLQCFINYLDTMARAIKENKSTETDRVVIFQALHSPAAGLQEWSESTATLVDVRFVEGTQASIFDSEGIRGDFANEDIGGGTLGNGAVQEEILFSIEPECLVARYLFPRAMQPTEAFMIVGSKTFSRTSGYGRETLRFAGPVLDTATTRHVDGHPVLNKYIVAFDAVNFGKHGGDQQYDETCVLRELNKAHTAFHCNGLTVVSGMPFATGNWGCGVFGGDPQ
ncbi:unnamed protein product [Vitrella brassicaformis CCMP3155]|uniref:poly(ADP-ribose) glycohydrolase n=1 Tax=Vitrella brassicaformis (strain CCMP3155) TaxID=1169540 RepID=A0A0G4GMN4_VITBC|nr:unnamed protein product [Vitrella brassicaformis CCMP3155]|eukprot:CEM31390.1 unnamed protein product [Vitrella brassicaformis CCMP3155]